MNNGTVLDAINLHKEFRIRDGKVVALDNVSFSVQYGSSLALVGESGAGKTTAARIAVGLETATAGQIVLAGETVGTGHVSLKQRRKRARIVQMVFQDPYSSLDPSQTIRSAINEILALHNLGHNRSEQITELGKQVGLDARQLACYPRQLSGGQRQRAAIARALAVKPSLIVLDEAVSALDVSIQAQILNLLSKIRQEGNVAYLLVSHDLAVVRQLCDYAIVMRNGQIVEKGTVKEILDTPRERYTKRLRDSVPSEHWNPEQALLANSGNTQ